MILSLPTEGWDSNLNNIESILTEDSIEFDKKCVWVSGNVGEMAPIILTSEKWNSVWNTRGNKKAFRQLSTGCRTCIHMQAAAEQVVGLRNSPHSCSPRLDASAADPWPLLRGTSWHQNCLKLQLWPQAKPVYLELTHALPHNTLREWRGHLSASS